MKRVTGIFCQNRQPSKKQIYIERGYTREEVLIKFSRKELRQPETIILR